MVTETDVVVVGAGPTGLMLAAELAQAGVRVELLDRRTARQRNSRALTLHPRSLEVLDQRGWADRVLALGRTVPDWHFAGLATRLDLTALDTRPATPSSSRRTAPRRCWKSGPPGSAPPRGADTTC